MKMTIKIQAVTLDNISDCVRLEVSEDQKEFVARNIATMSAESFLYFPNY
jgi:diamine N-acetyltransferase